MFHIKAIRENKKTIIVAMLSKMSSTQIYMKYRQEKYL